MIVLILSILLGNTPDMMLYLIYHQYFLKSETQRSSPKMLVTSDLPNHGTTSLHVMKAKAEIFGFLAVKIILAQTNAQIIVTKGDGIV